MPGLKATLDYRAFGFFERNSGTALLRTSCSGGVCGDGTDERVAFALRSAGIDQSLNFGVRFSFGP